MKKYGIGLGILILLVSGACFSCGCVTQPAPDQKIVYVDKVVDNYYEGFDRGYEQGVNDGKTEAYKEVKGNCEKYINKRDAEWKTFIEDRDLQWRQACEEAYTVGYNDASYQTITDLSEIIGTLGFLII
jgi:hypothetical protein